MAAKSRKPKPVPVVPKREGRANKEAHARDRLRIARLFYSGKTHGEIAALLQFSVKSVRKILAELDAEWRAESKDIIKGMRAAIIMELLEIKDEYRVEWERSKQDRVISSSKVVANGGTPAKSEDDEEDERPQGNKTRRVESGRRTEQRLGDPAYLDGARDTLKQIATIMGINAPTKHEVTGEDGKPIIDLSNLSTEQLVDLAKALED